MRHIVLSLAKTLLARSVTALTTGSLLVAASSFADLLAATDGGAGRRAGETTAITGLAEGDLAEADGAEEEAKRRLGHGGESKSGKVSGVADKGGGGSNAASVVPREAARLKRCLPPFLVRGKGKGGGVGERSFGRWERAREEAPKCIRGRGAEVRPGRSAEVPPGREARSLGSRSLRSLMTRGDRKYPWGDAEPASQLCWKRSAGFRRSPGSQRKSWADNPHQLCPA